MQSRRGDFRTSMSLTKISPAIAAVVAVFALSACGAGGGVGVSCDDVSVSGTDSTKVTCEVINAVNGDFDDVDLQSMGPEGIAPHFSQGIAEIEAVSNDAENVELAQSITTMADALRVAVGSSDGDLDAIHAEFQEQLQGVDVQDAAAHLDETCDARMNL